MELSGTTARVPGERLGGYRNSRRRRLRVVGLGERGSHIVQEVARRGYRNVVISTDVRRVGWKEIVGGEPTELPNLVIIVCGEGEEHLFGPTHGKPDMLVTFVVLSELACGPADQEATAAQIRGLSDVFVTTSDSDYVGDLVD